MVKMPGIAARSTTLISNGNELKRVFCTRRVLVLKPEGSGAGNRRACALIWFGETYKSGMFEDPKRTDVPPRVAGSGSEVADAIVAERLVPKIEIRDPGAAADGIRVDVKPGPSAK